MEIKRVYPIRLSDTTIQALAAEALKTGKRPSELARIAIEAYLKRRRAAPTPNNRGE